MNIFLQVRRAGCAAMMVLCAAGAAQATSIVVVNPGFETDFVGYGGSLGTITGWTQVGSTATYSPTTTQFPGGIPEGENVAAVDNGASIFQTLSATLMANTVYTLTVSVGQRADYPLSGYLISLTTGGDTLDSASGPIPAAGTFTTVSFNYSAAPGNADLGDALTIKLATTGANQAEFDAVSLSAVAAAPEPGTWGLLLAGFALAAACRRAFTRLVPAAPAPMPEPAASAG